MGKKEPTPTGFIIQGHTSKGFETYFETLLPGTTTDLIKHPKKDRVVRIIAGNGFVSMDDGADVVISDKKIQPGDEIVFKAGVAHRLATTSDQSLEFYVIQDIKYGPRLEVLKKSNTIVEMTDGILHPNTRTEASAQKPRRGSKAKQQQTVQNSKRVLSGQIINAEGVAVNPEKARKQSDDVATATEGFNVRPSGGRFDEAGAG